MKLLGKREKINNTNALCAYVFKGAYFTGNPFQEGVSAKGRADQH